MRRERGFTLLEVVLAVALTAIISLGAYQLLQGMGRSQETVLRKGSRINALTGGFQLLTDDFSHAVMRQPLMHGGGSDMAIRWQTGAEPSVWLLRDETDAAAGGQLEQVQWFLQGATLYRRSAKLNKPARLETSAVLTGVTGFHLRFYQHGLWRPNLIRDQVLPQAVEITLSLEGIGEVQRLALMGES